VVLAGQVGGEMVVGEGLMAGYGQPALDTPPLRARRAVASIIDGRIRLTFSLPISTKDEVAN
jgi:hypothetical protein